MSISDQLTALNTDKTNIANAITAKGGTVNTGDGFANFATDIATIPSGGGSEGWQPDPGWWDIEEVLKNDTRDYPGKAICLLPNGDNNTTFYISGSRVAVATSDGAFYTSTTTHVWDRTKDKIYKDYFGTRYAIYYLNTENFEDTLIDDSLYVVYDCNLTEYSSIPTHIQSFKFINGHNLKMIYGTVLDNFVSYNEYIQKLPDDLDLSDVTTLYSFCEGCSSLRKLPENLDLSNCTEVGWFCRFCYAIRSLPDGLDLSNCTSADVCDYVAGLERCNVKIGNYDFAIYSSIVDVESLKYIADNAPEVTGKRITLRSTNIKRVGGSAGYVVQTLVNKGWTVN